MRLLYRDARGVIRFAAPIGPTTPKYAILSHTWGDEEDEVSYNDLVRGKEQGIHEYVAKPGYTKLAFCAEQAKRDGYDHFWVDTCTIDKSSSAVLSESVNSMFQWYQQAAVCYAYLADVTASKQDHELHDQLMQSRWFRRGWTLQELLAPSKVRFFNQRGEFLGAKDALQDITIDITGINFGAILWPSTLATYSIATRLSWASQRETTRKEDMAYCLLGILDVHMPLLYGEGGNAFRRLQEELIKVSDDESVFAHSGRNLLAESPQEFADAAQVIVLRKPESAPYSITNAGLRIYMRVLPNHSSEPNSVELGILNCHDYYDEVTRDQYLALPLHRTTRRNTFRRADMHIGHVPPEDVVGVGYQDTFVQLKRFQVSRLTLLEHYDASVFHAELASATSPVVLLGEGEGQGSRFYPVPPQHMEAVRYRVQIISSSAIFEILIFFDLENDRTGLMIKTIDEDQAWAEHEYSSAFETWLGQAGPTSANIPTHLLGGSRALPSESAIRVSVSEINEMKAFVWVLRIQLVQQ